MANRLVINETIAAYANAAIDGANATGGRDAVVEVRNQMRQILGFVATNIDLRLSLDNEAYTAEERQALAGNAFDGYNPVVFFDFADYIHRLCASDAELTKRFNDVLSQLVPYERHTEYYFSSLTYAGKHRINTCCGLTISAPSTNTMVVNSKPKSHFYALFR